MIYSLHGTVLGKEEQFVVIGVGGIGLKVFTTSRTRAALAEGQGAELFSHLHVKEDALDLYGFIEAEELRFFELLIGISGVGPKSALAILDIAALEELSAAIQEGRPELLSRASGIGKKTAERIILELRGKVVAAGAETTVKRMEGDTDLVETLVSLGYRREEARAAVQTVPEDVSGLEARLKAALKALGTRK